MVRLTGNAPVGTPNWIDLGIPDLELAKDFYGTLFGWDFQDYGEEAGHYHACLLHGEPVAGMMRLPEPAPAYWWGVYFSTDDADGTVKRVIDAGGSVVNAPMEVMGEGRMAILTDSAGAQFGLWEGQAHIGSVIVNEPGSYVWNELVTPSSAAAREFYTSVFDFTLDTNVPEGRDYAALTRPDGQSVAGIAGDPNATGSAWVTYFDVADPDAAVRTVRERGGTVLADPEDTPYGRIASVKDPFGAEFRLMNPSEM